MALTPYPTDPDSPERGIALYKLQHATAGLLDDMTREDINRLAGMVSAKIERYAPAAPEAVKDEAMIRAIGWLVQSNTGTVQTETVGSKSLTYDVRAGGAWFRLSAAQSILSAWRVRGCGMVEA